MNPLSPRFAAVVATVAIGAVIIAGCGDASDDNSPAATSPSAQSSASTSATGQATTTPAADDVKTIDITMTGTKVNPVPSTIRVDKGTTVELTVTRDSDGEIHVHGADEDSKEAKAGVPVTFTFVAAEAGVYEAESHDPDRLLTKLQVS